MSDTITVSGLVATAPRHIVTSEGLPITSFRLASTQRRFDRSNQRWIDGETNWYTITSFRQLAINSASSIGKGDRVVVSGRLKIREWENDDRSGTNIEIEADALGHDLMWGTAQFARTISPSATASFPAASGSETERERDGEAGGRPHADNEDESDSQPSARSQRTAAQSTTNAELVDTPF